MGRQHYGPRWLASDAQRCLASDGQRLESVDVDVGELGRLLPEYLRLGAAPRSQSDVRAEANAFLQAIATEKS